MNRPRSLCPACELVVEWYSDGLDGRGAQLRCGNCFQGITGEQYKKLEKLQKDIEAIDMQRKTRLQEFLAEGGY